MPIRLAVPRESRADERRVALDPATVKRFQQLGVEVSVQAGAGLAAGHQDADYAAPIVDDTAELLGSADVVLKVQPPTLEEIALLREGTVLLCFLSAYSDPERVRALRERRITAFATEFVPRISRAQSMDALSSQAAVAGYKAALMAADRSGRFFPMLTTAAGTIRPSKVLVIGAGVAGLQAIATARRLGALVEAFDVRSATKEQVESLGARFIDTGVKAEGEGGYARELTEEEKAQQQAKLAEHVARVNAVITTAAIPGKASPKIITAAMVASMARGAVIIDLAAEGGGNCELTRPGEQIETDNGVVVYGPLNVPAMLPVHASEMYARNLWNFLSPMIAEGELSLDWEDEVIRDSALTHEGEIRHAGVRAAMGADQ